MSELRNQRDSLNAVLYPIERWDQQVTTNWPAVKMLIGNWWVAYKLWEKKNTTDKQGFEKAYQGKRMSVRTFGDPFDKIVNRTINRGQLKVDPDRFFADSKNTRLDDTTLDATRAAYFDEKEFAKYHAVRGLDSSAFANPANFASREKKYEVGVHDISASLLNPAISIFTQIHSKGSEAHFSFVPLSKEEDQQVLYTLVQRAKVLAIFRPDLYAMIRQYRAEMTRVKLAQDFDMAVGYVAVSAPRPGTGPQFKLRYGLGSQTTVMPAPPVASLKTAAATLPPSIPGITPGSMPGARQGAGPPPPPPPGLMPKAPGTGPTSEFRPVTADLIQARIDDALHFSRILKREGKNEIVLALRKHEGGYPLFAARDGDKLRCYDIVAGKMVYNGKIISSMGVMS